MQHAAVPSGMRIVATARLIDEAQNAHAGLRTRSDRRPSGVDLIPSDIPNFHARVLTPIGSCDLDGAVGIPILPKGDGFAQYPFYPSTDGDSAPVSQPLPSFIIPENDYIEVLPEVPTTDNAQPAFTQSQTFFDSTTRSARNQLDALPRRTQTTRAVALYEDAENLWQELAEKPVPKPLFNNFGLDEYMDPLEDGLLPNVEKMHRERLAFVSEMRKPLNRRKGSRLETLRNSSRQYPRPPKKLRQMGNVRKPGETSKPGARNIQQPSSLSNPVHQESNIRGSIPAISAEQMREGLVPSAAQPVYDVPMEPSVGVPTKILPRISENEVQSTGTTTTQVPFTFQNWGPLPSIPDLQQTIPVLSSNPLPYRLPGLATQGLLPTGLSPGFVQNNPQNPPEITPHGGNIPDNAWMCKPYKKKDI